MTGRHHLPPPPDDASNGGTLALVVVLIALAAGALVYAWSLGLVDLDFGPFVPPVDDPTEPPRRPIDPN